MDTSPLNCIESNHRDGPMGHKKFKHFLQQSLSGGIVLNSKSFGMVNSNKLASGIHTANYKPKQCLN